MNITLVYKDLSKFVNYAGYGENFYTLRIRSGETECWDICLSCSYLEIDINLGRGNKDFIYSDECHKVFP